MKTKLEPGATLVAIILFALLLDQYDPFHNLVMDQSNAAEHGINDLRNQHLSEPLFLISASIKNMTLRYLILESVHVPQILSDPPPLLFLAACIGFSIVVTRYRQLHPRQDRMLGIGLVVGILIGSQRTNVMESKHWLIWAFVFTLIINFLFHRVSWARGADEKHSSGGQEVVIHVLRDSRKEATPVGRDSVASSPSSHQITPRPFQGPESWLEKDEDEAVVEMLEKHNSMIGEYPESLLSRADEGFQELFKYFRENKQIAKRQGTQYWEWRDYEESWD
ncbi:hypothetical protein G7Y89_g14813 [Cudoniella acicularis]|uniref:Uncharacterized protein n=1 Tax=Cudoniella acicularis TaxID=354080 RepID=A0A8H4VT44_9HELO|nr:hypothetical protein G7Y89_g14813 [Cudoniella acicularis]